MGLIDVTPIGQSDDAAFGYVAGQRTARAYAYLDDLRLAGVAQKQWRLLSSSVSVNWHEFAKGFREGYHDELAGIAQPLPRTDVPYRPSEIDW